MALLRVLFTFRRVTTLVDLNPLTPKISLVILVTVYRTIPMISIWRIWHWIN